MYITRKQYLASFLSIKPFTREQKNQKCLKCERLGDPDTCKKNSPSKFLIFIDVLWASRPEKNQDIAFKFEKSQRTLCSQ